MRTVKRVSEQLNIGKWQQAEALVRAYADEKQSHLDFYLTGTNFTTALTDRIRRDELVKAKYVSPFGPQGCAWKLALKDAHETVVKWYAVFAEEIRTRIPALKWTESQRHYANWLIYSEPRLATLILVRAPLNPAIKLTVAERKQVQAYIRRTFRKLRGRAPQVRIARSLALDLGMYTVRTDAFRQVIEVAGLTPGKRIAIVLKGQTTIAGNIRLALDPTTRCIHIHTGFNLPEVAALTGDVAAVDAGLTEVFTDEEGNEYGKELGPTLLTASDQLCGKGRKRNKLHSVKNKAIAKGNHAKAARIVRNNLGQQQQQKWQGKLKSTVGRIMNHAINQIVVTRQPRIVVTENLDLRGKTHSKQLSRRVSLWHRSIANERVDFKASVKGFHREQVNPAYSSQLCPMCGSLDRRNRVGDAFQCLKCGQAAPSDRIAATNLKARQNDVEITRSTPPAQVKVILMTRYKARLESRNASLPSEKGAASTDVRLVMATVQGQTLETRATTPVQRRGRTKVRLAGHQTAAPSRPSKNETASGKTARAKCNHF
ncbi:MAG: transposase [Acidobacteria bacterium]|nr:transposase [Acidobacteriota bacterium]